VTHAAGCRRAGWLPVPVAAVLALGVALRCWLIPITHGQDFMVWDQASAATLNGVNVYAHHPHYSAGAYAYLPLWLYIELPFRWLSEHSPIPFQIAGKLPILVADVACAVLIAVVLRAHGKAEWVIAAGTAAFFCNPLVLYNSAYYGRFDSLGCALLVSALYGLTRERPASWGTAVCYALALAAKTFPAFVLFAVLGRAVGARTRILLVLVGVLLVLCLPYLDSTPQLYADIFRYDVTKIPQGLSWQRELLGPLSYEHAKHFSYALLIVFGIGTLVLAVISDIWLCTALILVAFLLASKVVLEQYLMWPFPFLIVFGLTARHMATLVGLMLGGALTVVGMLDNATYRPFEPSPVMVWVLAGVCLLGLFGCIATYVRRSESSPPVQAECGRGLSKS
jgi:hypothetical protein